MLNIKVNKYHMSIIFILTTLVMFQLSGIVFKNDDTIYAVDGVIDLHNFKEIGSYPLVGEFQFYPNEHINYGNFDEYNTIKITEEVPSVWNDKMDKFGIATYRLKVSLPDHEEQLALKVLPESTSFRIMVDDEVVMVSGEVGTNKKTSEPYYKSEYVLINPEKNEFELIVHVSNFVYARGGMWKQIILGSYDNIKSLENANVIIQTAIISLMITMIVFQTIMYMTSGTKMSISLVFCTFGILLRLVVTGEYVILDLIDLPFKLLIIMEYLSLYFGFVAWGFFLESLFKDEFDIRVIKGILCCGLGLLLYTIITPIHVFTSNVSIFRIFDAICCIYYGIGIIKAIRNKKQFSVLVIYCTYVVVIALLIDIIQYRGYNVLSVYGALVYAGCFLLFILSYIPLSRYIAIKEEMKDREFKMLSAQSNPHFLFNALNSIASLSLEGGVEAYDAIINFSDYLKATYTTSNYNDLIDINVELNLIKKYLETEKLRFKERLSYEIDMDDMQGIKVYPLLIQPIVENAVKHGISKSELGGRITLKGYKEGKYIVIIITNTGKVADKIEDIFNSKGIGIQSVNLRLHNLGSKLEVILNENEMSFTMKIHEKKLTPNYS